jgi:CotS family spore coat protein
MQEYEMSVLEQYEIEVTSTRKTRGAVLCYSNIRRNLPGMDLEGGQSIRKNQPETGSDGGGVLLLKEVKVSPRRIPALYELYEYLYSQGVTCIDRIVPTRDGAYFATLEDGSRYILKQWFQGRECDVKRTSEILASATNLAKLHLVMQHPMESPVSAGPHMKEEYLRHNRELKKVRRFTRGVEPKGEFEFVFLKYFEQMYRWADAAVEELESSDYERLYRESLERSCLTHGEYNYHNILMLQGDYNNRREPYRIATTNFEKFKRDVQVEDLYYFLRKVMEKQGWQLRLGDHMLNAYSAVRPLTEPEIEYLKIRLVYPEKFWKVANSYYHSNKAWMPVKNLEKLELAIRQTKEKKRFLEEIFAFHL